jgi:hypothetical protein
MFKFRQFASAALLLMAATITLSVAAQELREEYLPLRRAELGRPFALQPVAKIDSGPEFEKTLDIGAQTAKFRRDEDGNLLLTGKDRAGNEWSVVLSWINAGGALAYTSDLDRNGLRDLLLLVATGGNGLAPTSHIIAVTFERDGRPVRFEAEGHFIPDRKGIFDLRDVDGDGRAELLFMNHNDGYWITNFYTVRDARWRRIKGRFGGREFPLYTRFTNRPNRRAVRPAAGRRPFAPDLSNDAPRLRELKLRSYAWANVSQSEDIELNFETSAGQQVKCQPVSWYGSFTVVLDSARERKIFTLAGRAENVKTSLDEIVAGRYDLSLYGQRNAENCSPETLWVTLK